MQTINYVYLSVHVFIYASYAHLRSCIAFLKLISKIINTLILYCVNKSPQISYMRIYVVSYRILCY